MKNREKPEILIPKVVIIFFVQVCQKPRSGISCAAAFGCAGVADKKMKANFTYDRYTVYCKGSHGMAQIGRTVTRSTADGARNGCSVFYGIGNTRCFVFFNK